MCVCIYIYIYIYIKYAVQCSASRWILGAETCRCRFLRNNLKSCYRQYSITVSECSGDALPKLYERVSKTFKHQLFLCAITTLRTATIGLCHICPFARIHSAGAARIFTRFYARIFTIFYARIFTRFYAPIFTRFYTRIFTIFYCGFSRDFIRGVFHEISLRGFSRDFYARILHEIFYARIFTRFYSRRGFSRDFTLGFSRDFMLVFSRDFIRGF